MPLEDQIRQALDRALVGVRGHLESDLRAFAQDLGRAAAEERTQAIAEAVNAAVTEVRQKAHAQLAHIRDAAQKHTDELRRSAESQITELRRALEDANQRAQSEIEEVRRAARAEVEDARRTAQAQVDDVQRALNQQIAEVQSRLADTERRFHDAARDAERRLQEAAQRAAQEKDEIKRIAAAEAEELIVSQLAVAAAEHERRKAEAIEQIRLSGRKADQAYTSRLAQGIRTLDDARSLGEVLELLAQAAGRETERVAVLVARGDKLVGWTISGFGEQSPAAKSIALDPADAGLAGEVLRSSVAASKGGAAPADASVFPPFARTTGGNRDVLALPVTVGGVVSAVLYADAPASDTRGVERWPSVLDILVRHASKVLEALTVQHAVGLSLPRPLARASHDAVASLSHDRSVQ